MLLLRRQIHFVALKAAKVPNFHSPILGPGSEPVTLRRQGQRPHVVFMPGETMDDLARPHIPDLDLAVSICC